MESIIDLYKSMYQIRRVEETLLELFSNGYLSGTVHTCIGQEACAVGVFSECDLEKDIFFSNHRGHGHFLSYTNDVKGLIAEIMGLETGVCNGLGGSQHLQIKNLYTNGIQGAGMPIVTGMALAEKEKKSNAITVIFIGDGTFGEGAVYESFNIMSLWKLPILVVVENNKYAQSTPSHLQHAGDLSKRGNAFDIHTILSDGMDVLAVKEATKKALDYIKTNSKPVILHLDTYRFAPHSKGDDFRDESEINEYKKLDPLLNLKSKHDFNVAEIEYEIDSQIKSIVNELISK